WLVSLEGGEPQRLASPVGYKESLAWSPDGEWIAFVGAESHDDPWAPRNERVYVVSTSGEPARNLSASVDRAVGNSTLTDMRGAFAGSPSPAWSSDSGRVYFMLSNSGSVQLHEASLASSTLRPLTPAPGDVSAYSVDRFGSAAVVIA